MNGKSFFIFLMFTFDCVWWLHSTHQHQTVLFWIRLSAFRQDMIKTLFSPLLINLVALAEYKKLIGTSGEIVFFYCSVSREGMAIHLMLLSYGDAFVPCSSAVAPTYYTMRCKWWLVRCTQISWNHFNAIGSRCREVKNLKSEIICVWHQSIAEEFNSNM